MSLNSLKILAAETLALTHVPFFRYPLAVPCVAWLFRDQFQLMESTMLL